MAPPIVRIERQMPQRRGRLFIVAELINLHRAAGLIEGGEQVVGLCLCVKVNDALEADPSVLNSDAYGKGWIFRVRMSDSSEIEALLSASDYEALLGKS